MAGWCGTLGHGGVRMRAEVIACSDGKPCIYVLDGDCFYDCPGDEVWERYAPTPDWTDPATLGCLLGLVREAWGDPYATVEVFPQPPTETLWLTHVVNLRRLHPFRGASEAEALLAALEAATQP